MELCRALDKHEPLYSYIHACKFADWRRHELVAGHPTIFLGNTIVLIPMILNGHAGAKYGIPFPVFARASFGVRGANIPAMLRAIVACGWFGIQTWIGGFAIYLMIRVWIPAIEELPQIFPASFGFETGPALHFLFSGCLNMFVVYLGVESIKKATCIQSILSSGCSIGIIVLGNLMPEMVWADIISTFKICNQ